MHTHKTFCGVPGGIRTPDLLVRSQSLYPAELQAHVLYDLNIISRIFRIVNNNLKKTSYCTVTNTIMLVIISKSEKNCKKLDSFI